MRNRKIRKSEETQQPAAAGTSYSEVIILLQNTLNLLAGVGAAQILRALLFPVIARLFPPAALGIAQNFSAIGKTSAVLATLRYEDSIQLPEDESKAFRQMLIAFLFTIISSVLSLLIILIIRYPLAAFLNAPEMNTLLLTLPLFILARGSFLALRSWHIRRESYTRVSTASLTESAFWDGSAVGLGIVGQASSAALVGAQVVSQTVTAGLLAAPLVKIRGKFRFSWEDMWAGIKEYRKFPLYNTWSKLLDNTALYLPVLLFSALFSPAVAGQFTLGFNLLQLPFSMIANAVGQVLYQRAPDASRSGSLDALMTTILETGIKTAVFPVILFAVIGQEIVTLIFGANWAQAGTFAQILSPWMLFIFLSLAIERIPAVLGKNENILAFHALNTVIRAAALLIGAQSGNAILSIALLSIGGSLVYGANILSVSSLAGLAANKTAGLLVRGISLCVPFAAGLLVLKILLPDTVIHQNLIIVAAGILLTIIYYGILFLKDTQFKGLIRSILKKI